ncbi:hypothetical protein PV328_012340, partial [Microctonus aethiopoides]
SLRESFIKFDKFVRENREKRERAELKVNKQKERQTKITEEIGLLELKLDATVIVRDKMKRYVNDYKKSLMEARKTLADHQNKALQKVEGIGTNMQRMIEEREHKLMSLNNELATLQTKYNRIKAETLKWENVVSQIKSTAADKNLELTQIKLSC